MTVGPAANVTKQKKRKRTNQAPTVKHSEITTTATTSVLADSHMHPITYACVPLKLE